MTGITRWRTPNQAPVAAWRPRRSASVLDRRFGPDDLAGLRAAIIAYAASLVGTDTTGRDAADEILLVAHELATNAVKHGGGRGRLRLSAADGRVWCVVSDNGPGLRDPHLAGVTLPARNKPGSRGLWVVRQMSDLTIATTTAGTTVTAAIPRRPGPAGRLLNRR